MSEQENVHPFAVEEGPDGKFYLHENRTLAADGRGYVSDKWPEGFSTAAAARAFAKKERDAKDGDFAANQGLR